MSSGLVLDAVVIGAGPAGLGASRHLAAAGMRHLVLERARIGESWRTQRWDSFRMNTPNWFTALPDGPYDGPDPDGFYTCDAFVRMLEEYAVQHRMPLRTGAPVLDVRAHDGGATRYRVSTPCSSVLVRNVVIASGNQNRPKFPGMARPLPEGPFRLHGADYRNPGALPDGNVLVVGSGASGIQIAEDILDAGGRTIYLATSRIGRNTRRYRGHDIIHWMDKAGILDLPPPPPDEHGNFRARGAVGARGTLSLQLLSARGAVLLGHVAGIGDDGRKLQFSDDLGDNIRFADEFSAAQKHLIDGYIAREGLAAPPPEPDPAEAAPLHLPDPPIRELDLAERGIGAVIWCTGFDGEFSWARLPGLLNARGQPVHDRGVSVWPGVCFVGLDFQSVRRSGTVGGVDADCRHVVTTLLDRG